MQLKDKVAIVTGSAHGIGRAYALGMASEGAKLVIADVDSEAAEGVAGEIEAKGGKATWMRVDVSSEESTMQMAKKTMEHFGRIDILVNNAAAYADLEYKPYDQISVQEWDRVMAINLRGPFLCAKAVLPHMKTQGKGTIINISSGTVYSGVKGRIHYTCSKAGVLGFTRALAREVGEFGIRVNTVSPGLTYTGRSKAAKDFCEQAAQRRCLKRMEVPEDLVGTVIFLSSDASDFITGQSILVDGGERTH